MEFTRAVPPGPAASPEACYTGLDLGATAPADRPYVVCNFVSSVDGRATAQGRTALLGGEGDRTAFHLLRTQVDAVLAGTGTLRVERYGVIIRTAELEQIRVAEGRAAQPLAVVISRSGDIPFDIPLFADPRSRVALYAPPETVVPAGAAEVNRHAPEEVGEGLGGVLRSLRQRHGVRSLLCEGGPALFTSLLAEDLVDELFLTLAATLVGGDELQMTSGRTLPELLALRLVWALEREGNLFLRYSRR
ncbi:MAG TPA: dihydrofolate reductase family protein [Solirubrobacteraceae bacterium]|nr:dihydrofolate reductase family protein [Solirubrobacteraceae bacterium]